VLSILSLWHEQKTISWSQSSKHASAIVLRWDFLLENTFNIGVEV